MSPHLCEILIAIFCLSTRPSRSGVLKNNKHIEKQTGPRRPQSGAKRPVSGRNVQVAKRPGGETSKGRNVLLPNHSQRESGSTGPDPLVDPTNSIKTQSWLHLAGVCLATATPLRCQCKMTFAAAGARPVLEQQSHTPACHQLKGTGANQNSQ